MAQPQPMPACLPPFSGCAVCAAVFHRTLECSLELSRTARSEHQPAPLPCSLMVYLPGGEMLHFLLMEGLVWL